MNKKDLFQICNTGSILDNQFIVHHMKRLKRKNHTVLSADVEKAFDKSQQSFTIKTLSKFGINSDSLNMINIIYKKSATNILLNGQK